MKAILLITLMFFSGSLYAAEPNTLSADDPEFGYELQQIHERALEYKAGKLKAFSASPEYLKKLGKAIKSPACTSPSLMGSSAYCPHCGWVKCAACSAAIAAAVVACGGPEDLPCIAAALGAMSGCIECLVK